MVPLFQSTSVIADGRIEAVTTTFDPARLFQSTSVIADGRINQLCDDILKGR